MAAAHGGVIKISSSSEYNAIEQKAGKCPVVIDFYADWCPPCRMMAPRFEAMSKEYKGRCIFVKVNVDDNRDLAQSKSASSLPTFVVIVSRSEVGRIVGADESGLRTLIAKHALKDAYSGGGAHMFTGSGQSLGGGTPTTRTSSSSSSAPAAAAAAAAAAAGSDYGRGRSNAIVGSRPTLVGRFVASVREAPLVWFLFGSIVFYYFYSRSLKSGYFPGGSRNQPSSPPNPDDDYII